jgi:hypothetical protein
VTTSPTRERLAIALAKPLATADGISVDDFDPWHDVIEGIHGSYASEADDLMVAAMEAVRDRETFAFIKARGFAGELMLYVLSGHGFLEYGTSPRGGWPDPDISDLWQPLIDKWAAHADIQWGGRNEWRAPVGSGPDAK